MLRVRSSDELSSVLPGQWENQGDVEKTDERSIPAELLRDTPAETMHCMADRKELLFTMLAAIALGATVVAFALETYYGPSALFAQLGQGLRCLGLSLSPRGF